MADELTENTVTVVLAGGKGTRLGALTRDVCKPALPFGAGYRNIDFTLSNCVNSGIRRVGVATQHKPDVLHRHLESVWRDRVGGPEYFIEAWSAGERAPIWGYRGTADAVFRNLETIEKLDSRRVLVLAGDHIYTMDYRLLLEHHCRHRADVTVGCVEVAVEDAHQFGILSVDDAGRVEQFIEKPKAPEELPCGGGPRVLASMGIYVFETAFLARVLRHDARLNDSRHDFGGDILPSILRTARVFAYPFLDAPHGEAAYWRDVGTPGAYWRAHMDLLGPNPRFRLDTPGWPVAGATEAPVRTARYAGAGRKGDAALIAKGCEIHGRVRGSVLFPGVTVGIDADVVESVVLPGAAIGRGCRLRGVIVDGSCRIPDGMVVDRFLSGDAKSGGVEPVVLTAEDIVETVPLPERDWRPMAGAGRRAEWRQIG